MRIPDKKIFCDCRLSGKCRSSLKELGYEMLPLRPSDNLPPPVASHPDMICHRLEEGRWVFEKSAYENNKEMLDGLELDIIIPDTDLGREYPDDIPFNAARVADVLICHSGRVLPEIREHALSRSVRIVHTRQGYAKCSSCVAGDGVITSDPSIYASARSAGLDCLPITPGHIRLDGYGAGFIGGCAGMLDERTLAFTGDLRLHPDYLKIKAFTKRRGIDIICLSDEALYDYGSLYPL